MLKELSALPRGRLREFTENEYPLTHLHPAIQIVGENFIQNLNRVLHATTKVTYQKTVT